jgi:hypothetical protein
VDKMGTLLMWYDNRFISDVTTELDVARSVGQRTLLCVQGIARRRLVRTYWSALLMRCFLSESGTRFQEV